MQACVKKRVILVLAIIFELGTFLMDNKNEQNPEFSALVEAINCNDVIKVNTILSKGFDVNQYGKNKTCTPLEFAV